jgi:hypothetical protein
MDMENASLNEILLSPKKFYKQPSDVSNDSRLNESDKRKVLEAWKADEEALLRASDEGLDGGEQPHLKSVAKELAQAEEKAK